MNVHELLNNSDWQNILSVLDEIHRVHGATCSRDSFTIEDVKSVVALANGVSDYEKDWLGVFALRDGRFVFIAGGCCYTGREAAGEARAFVSESLPQLIRHGLGEEERFRLNLSTS